MAQLNFFTEYVTSILDKVGMSDLSEEQKKYYVPQISALLEERVGLELLPKLNKAQMAEFGKLVDNPDTKVDVWKKFWYGAIPTFEQDIARIMTGFAEKAKTVFAK